MNGTKHFEAAKDDIYRQTAARYCVGNVVGVGDHMTAPDNIVQRDPPYHLHLAGFRMVHLMRLVSHPSIAFLCSCHCSLGCKEAFSLGGKLASYI